MGIVNGLTRLESCMPRASAEKHALELQEENSQILTAQ